MARNILSKACIQTGFTFHGSYEANYQLSDRPVHHPILRSSGSLSVKKGSRSSSGSDVHRTCRSLELNPLACLLKYVADSIQGPRNPNATLDANNVGQLAKLVEFVQVKWLTAAIRR